MIWEWHSFLYKPLLYLIERRIFNAVLVIIPLVELNKAIFSLTVMYAD